MAGFVAERSAFFGIEEINRQIDLGRRTTSAGGSWKFPLGDAVVDGATRPVGRNRNAI